MRQAIAASDNIYAVNTIMKIGADKVSDMATKKFWCEAYHELTSDLWHVNFTGFICHKCFCLKINVNALISALFPFSTFTITAIIVISNQNIKM